MGKRRNRKHKKLLKDEKKPHVLLEQDDTKGKQIDQKSLKNYKNVMLPIFCSDDFTYKHFTDNTVIKNQCLSNEYKPQNGITENVNGTKRKQTKQKDNIQNNPKAVISKENEDSICNGTTIKNQCLSNDCRSQKLHVTEFSSVRHASDIINSQNMYEFKDRNENQVFPVLNMSGVRQKQRGNISSEPEVYQTGKFYDKFFFHDSDSDDENMPSNFYNSSGVCNSLDIFRDEYECKNLSGVRLKQEWNVMSDPDVYQKENNFDELCIYDPESDDEYMPSYFYTTPDFSSDEYENRNLEGIKIKNNFYSSVNQYKHSKDSFSCIYHKWLPERESTLEKLRSLYKEVHEGQMKYIESQASLKDISGSARSAKCHSDSQIIGFFASAMTLLVDAASGASSFTQAYNTDWFQIKFQEIMDHDAEVTKDLYEIRSQCVAKYEGIEEVMKKFPSDTLSSTVNKISDTLEVNKYWEAMKNAYKNDDMPKLMDEVGKFFNNACQSEILGKVSNSIGTYVHDNPAALEGCKSTGKAMYEAVSTCTPFYNRKGLRGVVESTVEFRLMLEDKEEAKRLKNISKDYIQSKLESQIEDAIDLLESEMKEVIDTYFNLFKS